MTRIELRSGAVQPPIRVGNGPSALAVGEGAVWVANRHDGTLSQRSTRPERGRRGRVAIGGDPTGVAVGEGSVWVTGGEEGRRRAASSPAGRAWASGSRPGAARRRSRWPAARCGRRRTPRSPRIAGARCAPSCRTRPGASFPWTGCTRAAYTTWGTSQLSSLAYDGLVSYRRVEGPAGATLVGALATTAPAPTDEGRTYVFTLRRGLRFSDGSPVRPTDVRASMERFLQATSGRAPADQLPPFFAGIVGAPKCMRGKAECELAPGIEVDDQARTVTIRLSRPDTDFLHKLATSFAFVVPAGKRPPRVAGPYAAGHRSVSRHRLGLEARRHARPQPLLPLDSRAPVRPGLRGPHRGPPLPRADDGAPDRGRPARRCRRDGRRQPVQQRGHGEPHPRAGSPVAGAAPQRPAADLGVDVPQRAAAPVRRPARAPGDQPRDRPGPRGRAVGWRRRWRQATCQIVPTGFAGYVAVLPIHGELPRPARGGPRPNLERARRLVAESGRAGERVVIHMPVYKAPARPLLREAAARARLPDDAADPVVDTATTSTTRTRGPTPA